MQCGELPLGGGLAVLVHKHLIKFQYKPCPCHLFQIGWVEDGVDFLHSPGACGSSLHVRQDKQDIAALIWCRWCSALNHATNPSYPDTELTMSRIKTRTGPSVSGSTVAKIHFSNQNKWMNPLFQKVEGPSPPS